MATYCSGRGCELRGDYNHNTVGENGFFNLYTVNRFASVARVCQRQLAFLVQLYMSFQKQHMGFMTINFVPRSHSYYLSIPLCLEWYNGSITPRVHSGVTKPAQC